MKQLKRPIKTLFEQGDDYCKPVRESNFWNNHYVNNECNGVEN